MISLCMIVKNEETSLKKCLAKVVNFIDEIIVVDTGSIDNTKNVALEFTEKVYDYKWCSNFSLVRNFSISKATNNWILILDADEYVSEFYKERLDALIGDKRNEKIVGRIEIRNIIEDNNGSRISIERVSRLFNKIYYQFEGIIHEQIVSKDGTAYNKEPVNITVNHIGYTKEVIAKTNKLKRNMDMLTEAVKITPDDPYLYFQLGKTSYLMREYTISCSYFEKALSFQLDCRLEFVEDLIETYGYALINCNRYSDAMKIENYFEIYKNIPDFLFLLGLIYMNNAKFMQAIENFIGCTKFSHGKMEGITTFLPYYNIGVIYEVLGHKEQANKYYKLCGDYNPAEKRLSKLNSY